MRAARIIALAGVFFSVGANADLTLRYDLVKGDQKRPYQALMLKGPLLRIDPASAQLPSILFNADNGELVQLHEPSQRYFSVNAETIEDYVALYRNNRSAIQGLLDHGLAQFAPRQKAQIERAIRQFDPQQPAGGALEVRPTGHVDQVLGARCRVVSVFERGQLNAQICIAEYAELGFDGEDIKNLQRLKGLALQFRDTTPKRHRKLIDLLAQGPDGAQGVPLKIVEYRNAEPSRVIQVGSISFRRISPQAYRIPDYYKPRSTPML